MFLINCVYRRKLLMNWNRYSAIRHAMRRFVTFRRWSTWSRWSRRLWGCTLVWTSSDDSLPRILQSVSETFHTLFYKRFDFIHLWFLFYVRDFYQRAWRSRREFVWKYGSWSFLALTIQSTTHGISDEGIVLYNIARTCSHLLLITGSSYKPETVVLWRSQMQFAESWTSL